MAEKINITCISDTHGQHDYVRLRGGDILLHAGDVSTRGTAEEVNSFLDWFSRQPYQYKIFIAGNHDFFFELNKPEVVQRIIPDSITYLNDSGVVVENLRIWGSPIQPTFFNWAFNRNRGEEIRKHWDLIPEETDILITHGPPYGVLDQTYRGLAVGCEELLLAARKRNLKIHVFGHIHEAYGTTNIDKTQFVNASLLDLRYNLKNEPINIEL